MKKIGKFPRRVYVLISVMGLWGAVIGTRLYFLHVVDAADLQQRAERQQQRVIDFSPPRGLIYDRNGAELAGTIKVDSVFAVPEEISDPAAAAKALASITKLPVTDLQQRLQSDKSFAWIQRKISAGEANAIQRAKIPGIHFLKEDRRIYPERELAAHVLGYVNMDDQGMGGLEYRYNDVILGKSGREIVMTDARGHSYSREEQPPAPGANLITTIDEHIQYYVEKEMQASMAETHAVGMSVIVMKPTTGEILAMANYPQFNPNEYTKYSPESWINRAVSFTYEPGSTFKILTVGASLEEGITRPDEMIDCQEGKIVVARHAFHFPQPEGLLSVQQIVEKSSDVGAIKLGLRLGPDRFSSYIDRMGFGHLTNIDLPGEERGLTKPPSKWSGLSNATMSIGQEIGVTPLQIISMVSAVANGGILYQPYVVSKVQDPVKGVLSEAEPHGQRVISTKTTEELREMLETVVTDQGTARRGKLEGYRAAGKTGTAQKVDPVTHAYSKTHYVGSFAGFAPVSNPAIAVIVVIDDPTGLHQGGQVAAPVFKRIAEQVLRYMSIPPDVPLYDPQYTMKEPKTPTKKLPAPALSLPFPKEAEPERLPASDVAVLNASFRLPSASSDNAELGGIAVPDFHGKSLRQVTEECLKLGLRITSVGSGMALDQFPAAGTSVRAGTRVQVRLGVGPGNKASGRVLMTLRSLLAGCSVRSVQGDLDIEVQGLAYDSRHVRPGFVFIAIRGERTDGINFVPQALANGAGAIVAAASVARSAISRTWVNVADDRAALAVLSANFYGHPTRELSLVGITGTNGKTTTTYIVESILKASGWPASVFGTIEYRGPGFQFTAERTTPEAPDLEQLFRRVVDKGWKYSVMEVSSHAISLKRVAELHFDIAVFTNLSRDHLDFHGDMRSYFLAKKKLFEGMGGEGMPRAMVLNHDDANFAELSEIAPSRVISYGMQTASDICPRRFEFGLDRTHAIFQTPQGDIEVYSRLMGTPNLYNIGAAIGVGVALQAPLEAIRAGIDSLDLVPGRFESVQAGQSFRILVDYAHSDDALRKVLNSARELTAGRLIVVFGCGGDRDRTKRAPMGEAAALGSDYAIVTSDNPRSEDPSSIIREIEVGLNSAGAAAGQRYEVEPDRRQAIRRALDIAVAGDTVMIAGKGHETYQTIGNQSFPFDDRAVAHELVHELKLG